MTTEKGVKLDYDKPRLDLVLGDFCCALWGVGLVGTFGATKYCDRGWKDVNNAIERYLSAMLRHYFKFKNGEDIDEESKLPHISHMAWNALAVCELYQQYKKQRLNAKSIDDFIDSTEESISRLKKIEEEQEENWKEFIKHNFNK